MIRKLFILGAVFCMFLYTGWNFYSEAIRYKPMAAVSGKHPGEKTPEGIISAYSPAWTKEILYNNLFSPGRRYEEPKPVVVTAPVPPPRRPELALRGIVLDTFGDYVAYVEIDNAKAVPMRKGDKVQNIEVADISARKAVIKWNNESINLSIEKIKTLNRPRTRE